MLDLDLFTAFAVVTALAAGLVLLAQRLGQSGIVAYLALGVIVGGSALDLVPTDDGTLQFAKLGIVLLLFFVGLEFHLETLFAAAKIAILGGFSQVVLTTAVISGFALWMGYDVFSSILAGFCVALSSTAIVMKSFEERRESDSATATSCVAVLIGQDLLALFALAAMPFLLGTMDSGNKSPWILVAQLVLGIPVFFLVIRKVLPIIFRRAAVARNQEAFGLCSLAAGMLVAVAAHSAGASHELGAFLGGLVFADTPYAHQIRADLALLKNLALGFFFVSVGMLIDLGFVAENAGVLLVALLLVHVLKIAITSLVFRVAGRPWGLAIGAGVALSQIGEFALVLPGVALTANRLTSDQFQFLVSLTVLSMLPAPLLVAKSREFGRWCAGLLGDRKGTSVESMPFSSVEDDKELRAPEDPRTRAIVVGYGPVGRTLCRILIRVGVEPCVIDLHLATIRKLHEIGRRGVYGDAGRREVLLAAGVQDSNCLLITLPDYTSRVPIITSARALNPKITIISRARYLAERGPLERAGVSAVAMEECEVAVELARLLLKGMDVEPGRIEEEVAKIHTEIETRTGFTRLIPRPVLSPNDA